MSGELNIEAQGLQPLDDRIIIKIDWEQKELTSGLIRPNTGRKPFPKKGEVIAVGPGRLLENGSRRVPEVKVGDRVLFQREHGEKVVLNGDDCLIMEDEHILGVLGEGTKVYEQ